MIADLTRCLIYGAYGFTGELIARLAATAGERPTLAGRDAHKTERLAEELGLPWRAFALDTPAEVEAGLDGISLVLNCAGPFSRTCRPMVGACLASKTHYVDITGEIGVFEACARRGARARAAGVLLLPGAGFDVVPSDCLALHLAQRMPDATHLTLAFNASGGLTSHGTATTMVESLGLPCMVRRDGELVPVRMGKLRRRFDFGRGQRSALGIPWGDLSTAYYTTGIPNIETYVAVPRSALVGAWLAGFAGPLLRTELVRKAAQRRVDAAPAGPTAARRAAATMAMVGEVRGPQGQLTVRQQLPEGYDLTAATALEICRRLCADVPTTGFSTPAQCFGADFILGFEGVSREDRH